MPFPHNAEENPRVLVVEDDAVSAKIIQRLFQAHGIEVDHAPDGRVALELHAVNKYRVVVSDWMMPEMDGVSLCRAFRALSGPYVYFILCSAKHQREDRLQAFDAGVDDFLTKPLDRNELQARLIVARRIIGTEEALQSQKQELESTAKMLAESNRGLRIASRRFEELFSGMPAACFTFDREGLIQEWNRAAHHVFGIDPLDALHKPVWKVIGGDQDRVWTEESVRNYLERDEQPTFDWQYNADSATSKFFACNVIGLRDNDGEHVGAICANLDITERKLAEVQIAAQVNQINEYAAQLAQQKMTLEQMNERLNHLAITDGLTGLWNHRRFQELLEESVDVFTRTGEPFSLVILDIDHFKRVNDQYGHQVGDEVLRQFAHTLRDVARGHEMPARYGGEEFAIILRRCDAQNAINAAERFRKALARQDWRHTPVSASFGVTTCSLPGSTPKRLIMQADHALYAAKQAGRDCVIHWQAVNDNARLLLPQVN